MLAIQTQRKHMKKVWLSVLGMGLSVGVTHACCGYEDAIQTALEGQGGHAIVFKHRFAVQPPQVQDKEKGKYTLAGHLIRVGGRTEQEDVIAYRIVREKGEVVSIDLQINGGMWLPIRESVMTALGDYRRAGAPMPEEKQQEVTRALEKLMDGSWQRAAEFLIAHIAARYC